jgi:hypothetical protein
MTVDGPGWRDQVVSTGGGQVVRAAGVDTDALLAVIRTADTSVQEARLAGGTLLRAGGREWPLQSGNERRLVTVEG